MGTYPADYTNDYEYLNGVDDASYTDPSGNTDTAVKVKKGKLSIQDLQGATFELATTDVPFTVWLGTLSDATLKPKGRLVVNSTVYVVLGLLWERPDGSKARIATRKARA